MKRLISLSLIIAAGLSSCARSELPPAEPVTHVVKGTISAWREAGVISITGVTGNEIGSGDILPSGEFTANMTQDSNTLFDNQITQGDFAAAMKCTGSLKWSAPSELVISRSATATAPISRTQRVVMAADVKSLTPTAKETLQRHWIYATAATQATGELDCTDRIGGNLPVKTSVALDLKPGWNVAGLLTVISVEVTGPVAHSTLGATNASPGTWMTQNQLSVAQQP